MSKFITLEGLARLLKPYATRISNIVSRGVVKRTDDTKGIQEIQAECLSDEVRDGIENMQTFGFASHPDDGAECVVLFPGGSRDVGFVVAMGDRRYRVKLEKGEACVYDMTGSKMLLKKNGDIELTPSSGKLKINGDIEATGDVVAGTISLQNHTHAAGSLSYVSSGGSPATVTGVTGGPS